MTEWNWIGAKWWKFDFHTHTPASTGDYGKGPDQQQLIGRTPREWLLDYMAVGVDCVAITDHNTGAWIDQLKKALTELSDEKPDGFRELYLFPGMEISVYDGVHVLAIFDPSKTTSDLDVLRGAVGYQGTPGESSGVTTKTFSEVVSAVVAEGGIAIPAHVDEGNGLFSEVGTTLEQALDCDQVFAMELLNRNYPKPRLYTDKGLRWTEVFGSDAHHPSGRAGQHYPGSHFTWVKMGSPGIEGLQLALLDGSLSICRSDEVKNDPNEHAPLVLESIEISRARYMGRVQPFVMELNPWLNTFIGGRGTGKSTVVEFLRLVLRRDNEMSEDLKPEFEKYGQTYQNREDSGLLTKETKIVATYRKNGSRFRVQWNPTDEIDPIQEDVNGVWKTAEGDIRQRFPARIYSQKQVFHLAKAPLALLKEQAKASLQRLLKIRRELTEYRRLFLDDVLRGNRYVSIKVIPYGARSLVEAAFRSMIQREGGGFEKDIGSLHGDGLLGELYRNGDGAESIEQALINLKEKTRRIASGQNDPATLGDQRFATHLGKLQPEMLDRLDLWFPEDSLDVQYSSTGDGQNFRSIHEGSPGQKTAALLSFFLSYGDEPLILDQPEDDLDNRLIYDLIVTQLREVKRHRQIIVVTHNANIVVNGDAELVVALAARGGQTQKECGGSLQKSNVRSTICQIMEGGHTAFKQRYRRIALDGRHV
jgi:hypothetical protein